MVRSVNTPVAVYAQTASALHSAHRVLLDDMV